MKKLSSLVFLSAVTFVSSATAATIFSDGLPTATNIFNTTVAGNFTAVSGNVDVLQAGGTYGFLCGANVPCIDLDGNTQGVISSGNLTLAPGSYTLSFILYNALRGVTGNTTVTLGSFFNHTYSDPAPGLVTATFTVASTTTVPLIFASNVAGPAGDIVSSVSIVTASSVPEPSTMLLSLPLLAFGSLALRRASARA